MFLNLALSSPRLLNQLGLFVLDEGQFITDPTRGITVELIFAMLLRARQRGISTQLVVLSAVIGNLNGFDRWLDLPSRAVSFWTRHRISSNSPSGRHPTGSAIQRLMSDSCQPVPLVLILT